MKNTFKEYNQFTEEEFQRLWEDCLFVFDTNTLLDMYRYNQKTVNSYFNVLEQLKAKGQLWIPYQVGYEFYENRIGVIYEYTDSYDAILAILEKAKQEIETCYQKHPFLDLKAIKREMDTQLQSVESKIRKAQKDHPKWMEKDDILDRINSLFDDNIGVNYTEEQLKKIEGEGKDRYSKKIPPGYKDDKYGDLILWYQIIDKAIETKRPIIFISGDVKEDWWLIKKGKRIMPLPQLKKEMLEKAKVDFHIYTADRFLDYYGHYDRKPIKPETIDEVRETRELQEKKMMMKRRQRLEIDREFNTRISEKYLMEYIHLFEKLERLFMEIKHSINYTKYSKELDYTFHKLRTLRNRIMHADFDKKLLQRLHIEIKELNYFFDRIIPIEDIDPIFLVEIRDLINRLEYLGHKLSMDDL
jgi:hypothetical protein